MKLHVKIAHTHHFLSPRKSETTLTFTLTFTLTLNLSVIGLITRLF